MNYVAQVKQPNLELTLKLVSQTKNFYYNFIENITREIFYSIKIHKDSTHIVDFALKFLLTLCRNDTICQYILKNEITLLLYLLRNYKSDLYLAPNIINILCFVCVGNVYYEEITKKTLKLIITQRDNQHKIIKETAILNLKRLTVLKDEQLLLKRFIFICDPNSFSQVYKIMSNYLNLKGIKHTNDCLRMKYGVDLNTYQNNIQSFDITLTEKEINEKIEKFGTKFEPLNSRKAITAFKRFLSNHGISALNTKLFMKYGKSLNDV